ncbi:MAG: RsmD family RNA methyltransferase [Candidatus Micrarchaeota archaeon]|nr:RsmD family RNA methyltransferase [Candidatus Micrarchaeota archaeon]
MFDIIGQIAVFKKGQYSKKQAIDFILKNYSKSVKSIFFESSKTYSKFRLKKYMWVWGEKSTETIHKENKLFFKLDLNKVFFSPRLAYERLRVAQQVKKNENVLVLFAGVGPFPITISKYSKAKKIIAIELNNSAYKFFLENIKLNRCSNIEAIRADVKKILNSKKFCNWADRILMPHPYGDTKYLKLAIKCLKNEGIIHYYDFAKTKNWSQTVFNKIKKQLPKNCTLKVLYSKIVRDIGPNLLNVVFDLKIKKLK